jgi:hypothetical protein
MSDDSIGDDVNGTAGLPGGRPPGGNFPQGTEPYGQPPPFPLTGRASARRSPRLAIAIGVAAVAMLGGAGVAYAASGSPAGGKTPTASPSASQVPAPWAGKCPTSAGRCQVIRGMPPFRRFGVLPGIASGLGLPGPAGLGSLVHGQVVIAKPNGGYEKVDVQRGKVTAVSASSISVRSADGYTASYAVASSTIVDAQRAGIGSVKVGNQVSVVATVSGSTASAASITDLTLLQQGRGPFGVGWESIG